jgi:hypothetical protein
MLTRMSDQSAGGEQRGVGDKVIEPAVFVMDKGVSIIKPVVAVI